MKKEKYEMRIHHVVSLIGGFMGAYGILSRTNNFGSAETTNMIAITIGILENNLEAYVFRLLALILYICAIMFTIIIPRISKINVQYLSLIIDAIGMVVLAFISPDINPIVALFPIFFMSAFQWNSFSKVNGYNCSTIFSTNNLRQTIIGFTQYVDSKKEEDLNRGKFFGATLLFYHLGVVYAFYAVKLWGIQGSIAGLVPVIIAGGMLCFVNRRIKG